MHQHFDMLWTDNSMHKKDAGVIWNDNADKEHQHLNIAIQPQELTSHGIPDLDEIHHDNIIKDHLHHLSFRK